ncbi:DUF3455 domain-containing protein [Jidongwangia harbinensis]|uniref:DUF3455 domain-containing protein n=1 Tax=Jidongwangia harbinensis TaxID=2878561 RepID=UPI001CD9328A|nr:DUF3455 domain-containing protein [Jidongwangia harbinensis]MCA2217794.1 DUF3455 domain-containing protein [Jidongwangia harbinensis]
MKKRTFRISAAVGALTLAGVAVSAGVSFAGTSTAREPSAPAAADPAAAQADGFVGGRLAVPDALVPPAGHVLGSVFKARGVQIYGCTDAKWTLVEPAASLTGITLDPVQRSTALHFRGPSWQSDTDGSLVEGTGPVSAPSATPNSIPQLLITAKTTRGGGVFGGVTYIQRLATTGGVAPAGACTAGQTTAVPYRAVYRFFTTA